MRQFVQSAPDGFGVGIDGFREAVGSEVMQARRVMPGEFGIATAAAAAFGSSVSAIGVVVGAMAGGDDRWACFPTTTDSRYRRPRAPWPCRWHCRTSTPPAPIRPTGSNYSITIECIVLVELVELDGQQIFGVNNRRHTKEQKRGTTLIY